MLIIEYPFASLLLTFIFLFLFPASAPSASPILLLFLSTVSFSFGVLDSASRFSFLFGHCRLWLWPMRLLVSTFLFIWVFYLILLFSILRFVSLCSTNLPPPPPPISYFFLISGETPFRFFGSYPCFQCLPPSLVYLGFFLFALLSMFLYRWSRNPFWLFVICILPSSINLFSSPSLSLLLSLFLNISLMLIFWQVSISRFDVLLHFTTFMLLISQFDVLISLWSAFLLVGLVSYSCWYFFFFLICKWLHQFLHLFICYLTWICNFGDL